MTTDINETLEERGSRYGEFMDQARIAQEMKRTMRRGKSWGLMRSDQQECLDMLANKMARILNGDHDYIDSWHDIIGYTSLVEKRLVREENGIDMSAGAVNTTEALGLR